MINLLDPQNLIREIYNFGNSCTYLIGTAKYLISYAVFTATRCANYSESSSNIFNLIIELNHDQIDSL